MAGVPRIFEKIYQGAQAKAQGGRPRQGEDLRMGVRHRPLGSSRRSATGKSAGPLAGAQMALADKLVLLQDPRADRWPDPHLRLRVRGSQRRRGPVVRRGRPADPRGLRPDREHRRGLHRAAPDDLVFGTVGQPFPGTAGADRRRRRGAAARARTSCAATATCPRPTPRRCCPTAGWPPATSARSTTHGRLKITDRKKDLVKTSGGKYIAPGQIAAQFKAISALASNLVVHANNRNFATALVSLDPDALNKFAERARPRAATTQPCRRRRRSAPTLQADIDKLNERPQPLGDDQEVHDPRPRPDRGGRRAHREPEGQAQGRRGPLRRPAGRDVRLI